MEETCIHMEVVEMVMVVEETCKHKEVVEMLKDKVGIYTHMLVVGMVGTGTVTVTYNCTRVVEIVMVVIETYKRKEMDVMVREEVVIYTHMEDVEMVMVKGETCRCAKVVAETYINMKAKVLYWWRWRLVNV